MSTALCTKAEMQGRGTPAQFHRPAPVQLLQRTEGVWRPLPDLFRSHNEQREPPEHASWGHLPWLSPPLAIVWWSTPNRPHWYVHNGVLPRAVRNSAHDPPSPHTHRTDGDPITGSHFQLRSSNPLSGCRPRKRDPVDVGAGG